MTSDTIFVTEDDKNGQLLTENFEVLNSEDDEDRPTMFVPSSSTNDDNAPPPTINKTVALNDKAFSKLYDDWLELDAELRSFEPKHKEYVVKLDEVESLKTKYRMEYEKYKKKLDQIQQDITELKAIHSKKGIII